MSEENGPSVSVDVTQLEEFSIIDKTILQKELVCNICTKLLNVPPILYNENLGNICGRCSPVTSLNGLGAVLRQKIYEELLKNLTFPCVNKCYGCFNVLKWGQVQEHEKTCSYRCASCPLSLKHFFPEQTCNWVGNLNLLQDHFKMHLEFFLDPPQFIWPDEPKNNIFLTNVSNHTVIIVLKHEKDSRYQCLLMINGSDLESQCFKYQLELFNEDKSNSLVLRRNRLEPLSDFVDHFRDPEKTLEIDLKTIREMLQESGKIHAKFGIVKKHKKEITQIMGTKECEILANRKNVTGREKSTIPDEEMLAELECPVCNEYMIPPIFICPTGHSVCSECKIKVGNCPSCRCRFEEGRNFTLEKLTARVKYPCHNREIGCGFVSTSDKIKLHQSSCELSENNCLLQCGWKGLVPAMYNHLVEDHPTTLLEHNKSLLKDSKSDKNGAQYFFYVMGEIFCFSFKNCAKNIIKFNVTQAFPADTDPQYKYTVQFSGRSDDTGPGFGVTNFCQNWTNNLGEALNNGVTIPADLTKLIIFQNHFYFKVTITKV